MFYDYLETPLGLLEIITSNQALLFVDYVSHSKHPTCPNPLTKKTQLQLIQYFEKTRQQFDLPLNPKGTQFQQQVWQAITTIPFKQTRSYADIAKQINSPKSFRAVGNANHNNPISIIIPCHRVIGKNGDLVGYAGGLAKKKWLLENEAKN